MRRSFVLAVVLPMLSVLPGNVRAQELLGVVYDSTAGIPVAGAVVSVIDSFAFTLAQTTTDVAGRFSVYRGRSAARLDVIRIGYRPNRRILSPRDTTIEIALTRIPPLLAAVRVSDRPLCPGSMDRGAAFQLWEQVRAGLSATAVARRTGDVTATTLAFRRRLSPSDETSRDETQEIRRGETTKPFAAAVDGPTLARTGYMTEDATGRAFFGLDEDVIIDDAFAATHCFHLARGDAAHGGQIGLAFDPAPGRDTLVEVAGVIWLNAAPLALRTLDFKFTGLEPAAERGRSGGRVEFQTAANGVPLATFWSLRMPILASVVGAPSSVLQPRLSRGRRGRRDLRLAEVIETGGELLEATWPDGSEFRAPAVGIAGSVSRDGAPVADAVVTLRPSSQTATSDTSGAFELAPLLAGSYTVAVVDTALSAYVEPRRVETKADVQKDQITRLGLALPSLASRRDEACKRTGVVPPLTADVFGRVSISRAVDGSGIRVLAAYERRDSTGSVTISDHNATVERDGSFRLCGVPRGQPVTLRALIGSFEADTTFIANDRIVTSLQWRPNLVVASQALRTLRGVVVDSGNRPLRDVRVSARGTGTMLTDDQGRFRVQLPAGEAVVLDLRRLGFTPVQYSLRRGTDTAVVIAMLPLAHQLATVEVTDRAIVSARLAGFEERLSHRRQATTGGYFITSADIDRRKPDLTTSLFTEIPSMRVKRVGLNDYGVFGTSRDSRGGATCPATIYLDGQRIPDVVIDAIVQPLDVAGIEVYPSANAAPPQYQLLNGGCAVVLIWRKGAARR